METRRDGTEAAWADLLASYPRSRPPLTPAHEARFVEEYRRNRSGRNGLPGVVARLESWMHRAVAEASSGGRILELGAGTLNHLPYEPQAAVYDVVEPFRSLWEDSHYRPRITQFFDDIREIPKDRRYDRILSIAVLEHLTDLPGVLACSGLLLEKDGVFQAGCPSEGGLLWGLAWRTTTGVAFRLRTGLSYSVVMNHEHVNSFDEIAAVAAHFFTRAQIQRFPLPFKHFSFYSVLEAWRPRLERCAQQESAAKSDGIVCTD